MKILYYQQFIKESFTKKKALIITAEGFQDQELLQPKTTLENNNVLVTIAGIQKGVVKSYNSETTVDIEADLSELDAESFDILVLPGGKAPGILRENQTVLNFVKKFADTGKYIAAICHGPLILASADLVDGVKMTCFSDAKEELIDAGADYQDDSCVVDGQFITSRNPGDLDIFCEKILSLI